MGERESEMLKTETNTPEMYKEVLAASRKKRLWETHNRIDAAFDHLSETGEFDPDEL